MNYAFVVYIIMLFSVHRSPFFSIVGGRERGIRGGGLKGNGEGWKYLIRDVEAVEEGELVVTGCSRLTMKIF